MFVGKKVIYQKFGIILTIGIYASNNLFKEIHDYVNNELKKYLKYNYSIIDIDFSEKH